MIRLVIHFMKILCCHLENNICQKVGTFNLFRECFREDLEVNRYLPIAPYLQICDFRETYHIKYFTPGFIRRVEGFVHGEPQYVDDFISEKVDVVEKLLAYEDCDANFPIEDINGELSELHDLEERILPMTKCG